MNTLDTAAIFGMAAGRHGPSAIDDAMRIVDLHKSCSDLQTAYDDSVDHFADSFDAAMSSIQRCQIIDSVPTIENFPSWVGSVVCPVRMLVPASLRCKSVPGASFNSIRVAKNQAATGGPQFRNQRMPLTEGTGQTG